jgi:hypothetical protein
MTCLRRAPRAAILGLLLAAMTGLAAPAPAPPRRGRTTARSR